MSRIEIATIVIVVVVLLIETVGRAIHDAKLDKWRDQYEREREDHERLLLHERDDYDF